MQASQRMSRPGRELHDTVSGIDAIA